MTADEPTIEEALREVEAEAEAAAAIELDCRRKAALANQSRRNKSANLLLADLSRRQCNAIRLVLSYARRAVGAEARLEKLRSDGFECGLCWNDGEWATATFAHAEDARGHTATTGHVVLDRGTGRPLEIGSQAQDATGAARMDADRLAAVLAERDQALRRVTELEAGVRNTLETLSHSDTTTGPVAVARTRLRCLDADKHGPAGGPYAKFAKHPLHQLEALLRDVEETLSLVTREGGDDLPDLDDQTRRDLTNLLHRVRERNSKVSEAPRADKIQRQCETCGKVMVLPIGSLTTECSRCLC